MESNNTLRVRISRQLIEKIGWLLSGKGISICYFEIVKEKEREKHHEKNNLLDEKYQGVNFPYKKDSTEDYCLMEIWGEKTQAVVKEIFNQAGLDFAVQA